MDAVADRVIRAPRNSDAQWLDWLEDGRVADVEFDHWLARDDRLVVVAPHPDDEVLACGGLLAMHAARGGACAFIAVTDGDASHGETDGWDSITLAAARRAESERGLARLGVDAARDSRALAATDEQCTLRIGDTAIHRAGLPDGAVQAHSSRLCDTLHRQLRACDTVVTTWRLDGHPDHDATGMATAKVCAAIGARLIEAPVWMWHWAAPLDVRVPWHRMRSLPLSRDALHRKAAALDEHATQRTPRRGGSPVLDASILRRAAWPREYFFI